MSDTDHPVQVLIDYLEACFRCEQGLRQAFFEMPAVGGKVTRVTYVSYAVSGLDWSSVESWMMDNVLRPLVAKAGENAWLYWRNEECFRVENEDGRVQLRTRFAVLDKDLNAVDLTGDIEPGATYKI